MSEIFISYASRDRERVAPLAQALETHGWNVWLDRRIPAGRSFDRVIEAALKQAKCVVVVWSRHSINSTWVRAEASEGLRRNLLVPVAIDDVEPPLPFGQIQTADLSRWTGDPSDDVCQQFVSDVSRLLAEGKSNGSRVESAERISARQAGSLGPRPSVRWLPRSVLAVLMLSAIVGYGYRVWTGGTVASPPPAAPGVQRSLEFLTAEITRDAAPALRWKTRDAVEMTIDGHPAELQGILPIAPNVSRTFVLIARNRQGETKRKLVWSGADRADVVLRATPALLTGEQVRSLYHTRGFNDARWNPTGDFSNVFESLKLGHDLVVIDHATGLMWQQSGSISEMADWDDANDYLDRLNARQYAGFSAWRLPTMEELATLVEPTARALNLHIDPMFDSRQRWLWSGDHAGERYRNQAWGIDLSIPHANIHFHDREVTRFGWVRAVRAARD